MKNEPQHMLNHMLNFWGKSEPHMLIDFMLIKKNMYQEMFVRL